MSVTRKKIISSAATTYTKAEVDALIAKLTPDWTKTFIIRSTKKIRYSDPNSTTHSLAATGSVIAWGDNAASSDTNRYYYKLGSTAVCNVLVSTTSSPNINANNNTWNLTCRKIEIKSLCRVDITDGDYNVYVERGTYQKHLVTGRGDDVGHCTFYAKAGDNIYVANDVHYVAISPLI